MSRTLFHAEGYFVTDGAHALRDCVVVVQTFADVNNNNETRVTAEYLCCQPIALR
jgi:hypothetical protein